MYTFKEQALEFLDAGLKFDNIFLLIALFASIFVALAPFSWMFFVIFLVFTLMLTIMDKANGLIILVFFVTFGVNGHIFSENSTFFMAYLVLMPVLLGFWSRIALGIDRFQFKNKPLFWSLLAAVFLFVFLLIIGKLIAAPSISLETLRAFRHFIHPIALSLLMVSLLFTGALNWKKVLTFTIFFAVIASVIGLYQHFAGINLYSNAEHLDYAINYDYWRAYGPLGQPNAFAGFLVLIVPLVFVLFINQQKMGSFLLLALALFLTAAALFATISRTPIMAFASTVSICALYYLVTGNRLQKIALIAALLICALAASTFVINGTFVDRFVNGASSPYNVYAETASSENSVESPSESAGNEIDASDPNMGERIVNYEKALAIIRDNFWFGISPKTYAEVAQEYGLSPNFAFHHIHNLYLQIWIESGLLALVLFLSMLAIFFICCMKLQKEPLVLATLSGVLAFLMHNMLDYLFVHGIQFLFGILLAIPFIMYYQKEHEHSY